MEPCPRRRIGGTRRGTPTTCQENSILHRDRLNGGAQVGGDLPLIPFCVPAELRAAPCRNSLQVRFAGDLPSMQVTKPSGRQGPGAAPQPRTAEERLRGAITEASDMLLTTFSVDGDDAPALLRCPGADSTAWPSRCGRTWCAPRRSPGTWLGRSAPIRAGLRPRTPPRRGQADPLEPHDLDEQVVYLAEPWSRGRLTGDRDRVEAALRAASEEASR